MPIYEEKEKVNGQKRYYIRTYITDEYGNKKQITRHNKSWIGRDGHWEAQQEEIRIKNQKPSIKKITTLDNLFDMYFETIENTLKKSTVGKTRDNYNLYIRPFLGNRQVFKLETMDIIDFHNYLDNQKMEVKTTTAKRKKGTYDLSVSYKQSIHTTLSTILHFGEKYVGLEKNVAHIVGNYKSKKGTKKKIINYLTVEEFNEYIKYESDPKYKAFFTILFYTGLRRGELLGLTVEDINFEENTINIDKSINPKNGTLATIPKTDKSNRTLQMLGKVSSLLKEYIKYADDKTIFGLKNIKPTTLQRKCDRNCLKAGIDKNIRIHDFRHSFASLCINNNVPIEILSEYLGHESISTTMNTYAHLYPNSQDKLINILNNI